jgi:hypothetical protein
VRKAFITLLYFTLVLSVPAYGATQTVGGSWLVEGGGYAKKSVLRVELTTNGMLDIRSSTADEKEILTGYEVWGELNASRLGINAWSYHNDYELSPPVEAGRFEPTLNEPYRLPTFTIDGLSYTIVLTSENSGTVNISGYVDIDVVGRTDVNADCAIWRQGTPKPVIPDSTSGCDAGAGSLLALFLPVLMLGARIKRKD